MHPRHGCDPGSIPGRRIFSPPGIAAAFSCVFLWLPVAVACCVCVCLGGRLVGMVVAGNVGEGLLVWFVC